MKVMLYQGLGNYGMSKAELPSRRGWCMPQLDWALDVHHRSGRDTMDAALGAIGWRLHVPAAAKAELAVAAGGAKTRQPELC